LQLIVPEILSNKYDGVHILYHSYHAKNIKYAVTAVPLTFKYINCRPDVASYEDAIN